MKLQNSTILITGGTSGIGRELVTQLLTKGAAQIIVTGRNQKKLDALAAKHPKVCCIQSDVSKPEEIIRLYEEVTTRFPALNILINNAGIMRNLDLVQDALNLEDVTREIDIDLNGPIRMVQQFLPQLRKQKSAAIINVSSGLAFIPFPVSPIYSAAKAGLHAYTKVLRLQLKNTGVEVIELAPPGTETPLIDNFRDIGDSSQNMEVGKMVRLAIKGIEKGNLEIKPGISKVLKIFSRVAPQFFFHFMDKSIAKARAKNKIA